ncbi:diguanylate cyclase [Salinisphaera sp. T5B8]|uniref:diguanylate cyclase n=1 Tax=Salinisphaera sp. T5B8 TaxID=1304154 RepID=UPI003340BEBA
MNRPSPPGPQKTRSPTARKRSQADADRHDATADPRLRYRISRWRAEFLDRDIEQRYRRHVERSVARYAGRVFKVWAVMWLLFALTDYYQFGLSATLYAIWAVRLLLFFILLGCAALVARRPALATSGVVMTPVTLLTMTAYFGLYFVSPDEHIRWLAAISMVVIVELFVLLPNRVVCSIGVVSYTVLGTMVCVALNISETTPMRLVILAELLTVPAATGWVAAVRFETTRRREFVALEHARKEIEYRKALESRLRVQARTDPLTGASNRRAYAGAAEREIRTARLAGHALSFVMLDLDHFKQVNDTYGHAAGDAALVITADRCRQVLREGDVFGRLGGEEFLFILPNTDIDEAERIAQTLRRGIAERDFISDGQHFSITATLAVTTLRAGDEDLDAVLRRADAMLYEGKDAGRDRVQVA